MVTPLEMARFVAIVAPALVGLVGATSSCGGDSCGTAGAASYGLVASGSEAHGTSVAFTFGGFKSSANNDCPAPNQPKGVVSLTIEGVEMANSADMVALCIPRPDQLETQTQQLGGSGGSDVQFLSFAASDADCSYMLDLMKTPVGTVRAEHECGDGTNAAGFAVDVEGTLPLVQTCMATGTMVSVSVTLSGTTAVVPGNF